MMNRLRHRLRILRANGQYTRVINLLIKLHHLIKSTKERVNKNSALSALQQRKPDSTPKEWVEFIWSAAGGYFQPIQQQDEMLNLITQVNDLQPKSVLEIGTAKGGSLFLFCQASAPNATIVSVDLPGGINGGGYPNWKTGLFQEFKREQQTLHLLRCNSHLESTRDHAASLVSEGTYDLIMIDGDHSYEGVKTDFELYRPLLSRNGIMVFHDVIKNLFDPSIQVDRFWDELKLEYTTQEIIFDPEQGNMGIGIVSL